MADKHPTETWRPVVGYEGSYEVSDAGRVRSLDRIGCSGYRLRGIPLKLAADRYGYQVVRLSKDRGNFSCLVHRLVLLAFVGEPASGMQACHDNGIRSDNRLANLRWGTRAANMADRVRHGRASRVFTEITEDLVREMFRLSRDGLSRPEIARRLGVAPASVYSALARRTWKHVYI